MFLFFNTLPATRFKTFSVPPSILLSTLVGVKAVRAVAPEIKEMIAVNHVGYPAMILAISPTDSVSIIFPIIINNKINCM